MHISQNQTADASHRTSLAFFKLLEQQFPIAEQHPIRLRSASHFANELNIHVNHLNRAIKKSLNKTTTQVISERILQEAKILLKRNNLSVADISDTLGFAEPAHFSNFFKKHMKINPVKFRRG